jgi:hypothetical protein
MPKARFAIGIAIGNPRSTGERVEPESRQRVRRRPQPGEGASRRAQRASSAIGSTIEKLMDTHSIDSDSETDSDSDQALTSLIPSLPSSANQAG